MKNNIYKCLNLFQATKKMVNFFSLSEINFKHENKPRGWRDLGQILDCSLEIHTYLTNGVFLNIFFGKTGISTFFI